MRKMLRDGREKAFVADPAFPGATVDPQHPMQGSDTTASQGRSLYLQAHGKPEHTVGMCSSWQKQHRNILGAWIFPRSCNHTSNRTGNTLQDSRAAPGTWLKGKASSGKEGRALCQTIHTTNLQTTFSNTCGKKEELIPGYNLSNKLHSPIRKTAL